MQTPCHDFVHDFVHDLAHDLAHDLLPHTLRMLLIFKDIRLSA